MEKNWLRIDSLIPITRIRQCSKTLRGRHAFCPLEYYARWYHGRVFQGSLNSLDNVIKHCVIDEVGIFLDADTPGEVEGKLRSERERGPRVEWSEGGRFRGCIGLWGFRPLESRYVGERGTIELEGKEKSSRKKKVVLDEIFSVSIGWPGILFFTVKFIILLLFSLGWFSTLKHCHFHTMMYSFIFSQITNTIIGFAINCPSRLTIYDYYSILTSLPLPRSLFYTTLQLYL